MGGVLKASGSTKPEFEALGTNQQAATWSSSSSSSSSQLGSFTMEIQTNPIGPVYAQVLLTTAQPGAESFPVLLRSKPLALTGDTRTNKHDH